MAQPTFIVWDSKNVTKIPLLNSVNEFTNENLFQNKTVFNGELSGDNIKDEDDMVSDSAIAVPTQQSVKRFTEVGLSGKSDTGHTHTETDPVFTAWDKDYDDLSNKPTLYTSTDFTSDFAAEDLANLTTKSYTDLDDKPTLYTSTNFGTDFGSADLDDLGTKNLEDLSVSTISKTEDYTITTESLVRVAAGVAPITITLPSAATRRTSITVKLVATGGGTCIVQRADSATIDGATSKTLTNAYSAVTVQSDGTNWHIISSFGTLS